MSHLTEIGHEYLDGLGLSSAAHVRLLKAGGGYLKWRVYGVTIHDPTDATRTLRISLLLR